MAEKKDSKPSGIIEEISASKKYKSKKARFAHAAFVVFMLAIMFGVIAGITFGITSKVGLYYNDKTAEDSKSHVPVSTPVDPSSEKNPVPDTVMDVTELANKVSNAVVTVQLKIEKSESIFSETIVTYKNYAGIVVAKDEHNYYILVDSGELKKDISVTIKAGDVVLAGRYEGKSSALGLALVTANFDDLSAEDKESIGSLSLSSTKPKKGESIMAIGAPNGVIGSIDAGIVTSDGGKITLSDMNYELLTSNMKLYSEGYGFVVNSEGYICGLMVKNSSQVFSFIDLSSEIELVEMFVNSGKLPYVGLVCENQSKEEGSISGVYVKKVLIDSPADKKSLRSGDIIVAVDGESINDITEYKSKILSHSSGDNIVLKYVRNGEEKTVTIEIE